MNDGIDIYSKFLDRSRCIRLATELVSSAAAQPGQLAALWVDLDRFLQVNQSFGHPGGDLMLGEVTQRLTQIAGPNAFLGRMGGDEFLCLVPNTTASDALTLAHAMMAAIELPIDLGGITLHPTACVGIAMLDSSEDALDLLQRADRAMIAAKRAGRNRCVLSGEEPVPGTLGMQLAREELDIENKLHIAIKNGGLQLYYQPIMQSDGSIEAVEALMRCNVDGEMIPPDKFIPVAEKTGLVIRLGEWTLSQGALFVRHLRDAGFPLKVAVNVSRAQLLAPQFAQALNAALICAQVPSDLLELELTESLFMDMSDMVQENLCSARAAGVGLAIDDFGTGYSCLANLKDIHATKLKLDRSFVAVLPENQRAFAIVKAMTQLGQELGMTVVAEGVETEEQRMSLELAGVNAVQGYLYAQAMPGDTLIAWMRQHYQIPAPVAHDHDAIH
jgi:diguanylate cyclase (GGDEF)-like protein